MKKLLFLAMAATLAILSAVASSESTDTVPVLGLLMVSAGPQDPVVGALRSGLAELGYKEGQQFRIEHRVAEGRLDRLPHLARELVSLKAFAIVTGTNEATVAAKEVSDTTPIVAVLSDADPVTSGFIRGFNRPGMNITGLFTRQFELAGKRLELLKEAMPNLKRIAVLWDSFSRTEFELLQSPRHSLGLELSAFRMRAPYQFETALRDAKAKRATAVMVLGSPELYVNSARLGKLALANGLAAVGESRDLVQAGGLMSYSVDPRDSMHRAAYFVGRLLSGAKVSDLPMEQATSFRLVVNLNTARTLGVTIPESILVRADEVLR